MGSLINGKRYYDAYVIKKSKGQPTSTQIFRDAEIPSTVITGKYIITIISVLITNDMFRYFQSFKQLIGSPLITC